MSIIHKLLYRLSPKAYCKAIPESQIPDYKDSLELVFSQNGHGYYKFTTAQAIPNVRYLKLQTHLKEHEAKLSNDDHGKFISLLETCFDGLVAPSPEVQNRAKKELGYVISEMKFRHEKLPMHADVLCDIAAIVLIRDDEMPHIIDEQIHAEKKEVLKGHISDSGFFLKIGLDSVFPDFAQLEKHWKTLAELSIRMLQESDVRLSDFQTLISGRK